MTTHTDELDVIETTVQKTYQWIRELSEELGVSRQESYQILRGFLHALRDRLTVDEAAQLAAQLPMLVRGLYYEGWDPSRAPRKMKVDEFIDTFARRASIEPGQEPLPAMHAAARVLARHVTSGETLDVLSNLPADLRSILV